MPSSYLIPRDHCPACRSTERTTLFACGYLDSPIREHLVTLYEPQGTIELEYLEGGEFILFRCGSCGLAYQGHAPNAALMERLYEHWVDPERAVALREAGLSLDDRLGYVREVLLALQLPRPTPRLRAFDFGMGWGHWCLMAQALGCEVSGAERSPSRVANARAHGIKIVDWDEIPAQQFDLINCDQVLEHLEEPLDTLQHVAKALAPQGLLKVSVPDCGDLARRLARGDWLAPDGSPDTLLVVSPLQHINGFDHGSLVAMAARAGLRPARPALGKLYASSVERFTPGGLLAGLTRPLGRRFVTRDTYMFFERAGA